MRHTVERRGFCWINQKQFGSIFFGGGRVVLMLHIDKRQKRGCRRNWAELAPELCRLVKHPMFLCHQHTFLSISHSFFTGRKLCIAIVTNPDFLDIQFAHTACPVWLFGIAAPRSAKGRLAHSEMVPDLDLRHASTLNGHVSTTAVMTPLLVNGSDFCFWVQSSMH